MNKYLYIPEGLTIPNLEYVNEYINNLCEGKIVKLTEEELLYVLHHMNKINTLMIQKSKEHYYCKVDDATINTYALVTNQLRD